MIQSIEFRKATLEDLPRALELFREASRYLASKSLSQWGYWQDPPMEKLEWVRQGFDQGEFFFVFDGNKDHIAMFRLMQHDMDYWDEKGLEPNVRYIHSLVIDRKYAGKGIGRMIVQKIIDSAATHNFFKLRLDCDATNKQLRSYYKSLGFEEVGEKTMPLSLNVLYEKSLI